MVRQHWLQCGCIRLAEGSLALQGGQRAFWVEEGVWSDWQDGGQVKGDRWGECWVWPDLWEDRAGSWVESDQRVSSPLP